MSRAGIQRDEPKMAPDVDDIVDHHRDRARRCSQVDRPGAAAFRLPRSIGHVTPLLEIPARHGPLVWRQSWN